MLLLNLPTIFEDERRDEKEFWASFEAARPRIFGALLDALAVALANIGSTRLEEKPRMADFALWVTASEPGLGWEPGAFMRSYGGNRDEANQLALEASPIGQLLVEVASEGFEGKAADLLDLLEERADEKLRKSRGWPKSPRGLAGMVRRIAPNLRAAGIEVEFDRDSKKRSILLRPRDATVTTVTTVTPLTPVETADDGNDGCDGSPPVSDSQNDPDGKESPF